MVWTLMTAAEMPSASRSLAASRDSETIRPQANTATSVPSRSTLALPISKGWSSSNTGEARRAQAHIGGALEARARANTAFRVSLASAGTMTVMPGITRMRARSSTHWWLPPSSPTDTPAWDMHSLTLNLG